MSFKPSPNDVPPFGRTRSPGALTAAQRRLVRLLVSSVTIVAISAVALVSTAVEPATATTQRTMRPHLFLTAEKVPGLRSVADLRAAIARPGHTAVLWKQLLTQAERDKQAAPITPANCELPSRSASQRATANPDYYVCQAAGQRILRNALACLVTDDIQYRDVALRQIESLFSTADWPDWRDRAHRAYPADLRNGALGRDIAIAYDWMYNRLSAAQRRSIVDGLDRRAIQPFWQSVDEATWWVNGHNNWTTCIVGGMGIVGMALAEDHPAAGKLVDFSQSRMRNYLLQYGKQGEFNESVGYSAATRLPAVYYDALRYATRGEINVLGDWPFVDTALWNAYTCLPPGRLMAFGDAGVDRPAETAYFAAVAAASRNAVLQWFYLQNEGPSTQGAEDLPLWLLGFDATLRPGPPTGHLPLGRAFAEHGAILVSRSSWDPHSTPSVVYGKAGIERNHEHHDAGQVCIDGYGQRLIVDLGSPSGYPADFFGPHRWQYYNASWIGHNGVTVDGDEMQAPRGAQAKIIAHAFDDRRGGYWQLDLTRLLPGAERAVRSVVHLTPGIAAVVDEVTLTGDKNMSLRWHTLDKATPQADGSFIVRAENVQLAGRVVSLDNQQLKLSRGEHAYHAPYDTDRTGAKLEQRRESFIWVQPTGSAARILSLFAVQSAPGPQTDDSPPQTQWESSPTGYRIETADGTFEVSVRDRILQVQEKVKATDTERGWQIPM